MFTVTNLVDRNLLNDTQNVDIDNLLMTHKFYEGGENKYSLKRLDLIEPQKGRLFLPGDAYVYGMQFKQIMPSSSGPNVVSEIIGPKNKVIKTFYVVGDLIIDTDAEVSTKVDAEDI